MHESLGNTIDYTETRSRSLAETKRFFAALWLVVGRLRPGLLLVRRLSNGWRLFTSEKTADVEVGSSLVVFYFPELENILAQA